jgi:hypothetical protein
LEAGISTDSCFTEFAFLIRVSISAIGSVKTIREPPFNLR